MFNRANIAFIHDVVMAAASFAVAMFLRLGTDIEFYPTDQLVWGTLIFTLVAAVVFRFMRMYRGVWRYASLNDLLNITKSSTLVVLIFLVLLFQMTRLEDLPRSLPFINWFVLIALLGGPRFVYRLFKDRRLEFKLEQNAHQRIPVLLVGAGDSAELFIRDLARSESNYRVSGIVSGTPRRVGRDIHGIEILGAIEDIPAVVKTLADRNDHPQRLVVTSERIEGKQIRMLLDTADQLGMSLARLPALTEFKSGLDDQEMAVRPIDVEDLLGRPQTPLDRDGLARLVGGKSVLVTGAGGSIGSELVRQIAALEPSTIVLVENSEYNLYAADMELSENHPDLPRHSLIGDVRDRDRIDRIFAAMKPNLVFHAAALKHVPMVEANILEGLTTNVTGTVNVADAARQAGVETFIQISTDKAVNPTNIMGASKRIAESYCQALDLEGNGGTTRFVTVRFGNVLGSTGSVVELFRRQISEGGPVTVTDPDMKRYFMTVREAVELVMAAAALGDGAVKNHDGKIFVLEMGDPVLIDDLAKQMIRLAGLVPNEDIDITYTGLRPGEKLFEEIFHGAEELVPTSQSGLLLASPRTNNLESVTGQISRLKSALAEADEGAARAIIREMVPEYEPSSVPMDAASVAE